MFSAVLPWLAAAAPWTEWLESDRGKSRGNAQAQHYCHLVRKWAALHCSRPALLTYLATSQITFHTPSKNQVVWKTVKLIMSNIKTQVVNPCNIELYESCSYSFWSEITNFGAPGACYISVSWRHKLPSTLNESSPGQSERRSVSADQWQTS